MNRKLFVSVCAAALALAPMAVLAAAVFWTWLWGPLGLVMATPLRTAMAEANVNCRRSTTFSSIFSSGICPSVNGSSCEVETCEPPPSGVAVSSPLLQRACQRSERASCGIQVRCSD